jgi:hypothetical protein
MSSTGSSFSSGVAMIMRVMTMMLHSLFGMIPEARHIIAQEEGKKKGVKTVQGFNSPLNP